MANPYLNYAQLGNYFDTRTIIQLGNDANSTTTGDVPNVDVLIDTAADEVETALSGAFAAPILNSALQVPQMMQRLVASKAIQMLYGRRAEVPAWVEREEEWYDKKIERLRNRLECFPQTAYVNGPELLATRPDNGQFSITSSAIGVRTPWGGTGTAN